MHALYRETAVFVFVLNRLAVATWWPLCRFASYGLNETGIRSWARRKRRRAFSLRGRPCMRVKATPQATADRDPSYDIDWRKLRTNRSVFAIRSSDPFVW